EMEHAGFFRPLIIGGELLLDTAASSALRYENSAPTEWEGHATDGVETE
ncbi:hypothetical protein A2U01_0075611, partial [Trifolium medium]|nr:hypothetical protein [Trifolium medium]